MLTKSTIKFIKSLQEKKYRKQEQCFVVEGAKNVSELLMSDFEVRMLLGSPEYLMSLHSLPENVEILEVKPSQLTSLGDFQTNDAALAVARMKEQTMPFSDPTDVTLLLDDVRDPGNLGTILRTADWYGITTILASEETVDFYSPKVINASKGSFARIKYASTDLVQFIKTQSMPVYGAFLDGENIHDVNFSGAGLIVIGNESKGISTEIEKLVTKRITIPRFGKAESLNAAIATAIILDNVRR